MPKSSNLMARSRFSYIQCSHYTKEGIVIVVRVENVDGTAATEWLLELTIDQIKQLYRWIE